MVNIIKKSSAIQHNHKGFTLAETLITLVIIGVVAALTVPTLIVKHQKEETVTRLKKAYSVLSQTTNKAIADNGPIKSWNVENNKTKEFVDQYMAPYLSIAKNCEYENTGNCAFQVAYLNNPSRKYNWGTGLYKIILSDGTLLLIRARTFDVYYGSTPIPRAEANVTIDINGAKGPNIFGKDIFQFLYLIKYDMSVAIPNFTDFSGKFLPDGSSAVIGTARESYKTNGCNKNGTGQYCAALIMADNWEIKDDYPW